MIRNALTILGTLALALGVSFLATVYLSGCSGTSLNTIECDIGINCTPSPAVSGTPTP